LCGRINDRSTVIMLTEWGKNKCSEEHGSPALMLIKKQILIMKPTRCTKFQIYFWYKSLHVSDSSSVQHQEFSLYTQQWYMSHSFADSSQAVSKPV